tara:strand:- start:178 stop:1005 length:828 start_codon:yes stop_codon:yes gene_type:complete
MNDKYSLKGKTALITGAGGLLGPQHAIALIQNGAHVVLTDISDDLLNQAEIKINNHFKNKKIDHISKSVMDVTKFESIKSTSEATKTRIDILINNAAINPKFSNDENSANHRLEDFSIEKWNQEIDVGLKGAFLCCREFGNKMSLDNKGGVILNIASDLSVISPYQGLYKKKELPEESQPVKPVSYSVIKTGLIGLTRYIATYWNEKNIRCNALSPGGIKEDQDSEFIQRISSLIPLGRMAEVDEYHAAVQFLCSDASSYMNGQNIIMDGGRSIW